MAETLGSLCDKLATVKLKLWHTDDAERLQSLRGQEQQLHQEIDEFMSAAVSGEIPIERLSFAANEAYRKEGNVVPDFRGTLGESFAELGHTVCKLWHGQARVYECESVPMDQTDVVIKK